MGKWGTWGKAFLPHRPVCLLSRCFLRPGWNTGLVLALGTACAARGLWHARSREPAPLSRPALKSWALSGQRAERPQESGWARSGSGQA